MKGDQHKRDIKGNEHANKLAKKAAKEAEQLPALISLGDVKSAAKVSVKKKWQDMWDKSVYTCINLKSTIESNTHMRSTVAQLRTGYVSLNEYLSKCSIKDSDLCQCGSGKGLSIWRSTGKLFRSRFRF